MDVRRTQRVVPALVLAACMLLPAGCGDDDPPTQGAPELSGLLVLVDEAVAERRWPAAREAIRRLVQRATEAERDGSITGAQADRIRVAARGLLTQLPAPQPTAPKPTEPTSSAPPSGGSGEGGTGGGSEGKSGSGGGDNGGGDKEKPDSGKKGSGGAGKGGGKKP